MDLNRNYIKRQIQLKREEALTPTYIDSFNAEHGSRKNNLLPEDCYYLNIFLTKTYEIFEYVDVKKDEKVFKPQQQNTHNGLPQNVSVPIGIVWFAVRFQHVRVPLSGRESVCGELHGFHRERHPVLARFGRRAGDVPPPERRDCQGPGHHRIGPSVVLCEHLFPVARPD